MLSIVLSILLLTVAISMIRVKNNLELIIRFSLFSLVAATLYFINKAPDIALAEIAVGCAFIPLVYTISMMRQNTFTVAFFTKENQQSYCDPEVLIRFMTLIEEFCGQYDLQPKLITHPFKFSPSVREVFRPGNIDILADYSEETGVLTLTGNEKNVLVPRLREHLQSYKRIEFHEVEADIHED